MSEEVEMLNFEAFKERYEKVQVEEYPNSVREAVPEPVVSVHLLTYNHADYIREAIESVLMQEVDFPMEIVLGDDDSSDGTREICIEYAKKHPELIRLQLHHRKNNIELHGRPTHVFQYWYNMLTIHGKYIAILSGDDYWTNPNKLQKQISFLEEHHEYSFTHHNAVVVDNQNRVKQEKYFSSPYSQSMSGDDLVQAPLVVASSAVFDNVFDCIPASFTSTFHEDRLVTSTLGTCGKGRYYDEVQSAYRKDISGLYNGTDKKSQLEDKLIYLRTIAEARCKNDVCRHRIQRQIADVESELYRTLIGNSEYYNALKVAARIFHRYVALGDLVNAVGWILKSSRFLFGKLRPLEYMAPLS
jgi:glycosyltransferase involved in cell wall biosynthesis